VALVAATAALAVLGTLALGLARTTLVDQHLTRNTVAALQADALARSGIAVAATLLRDAGLAGTPDAPEGFGSGRLPLGAGWVEVQVEDAARRLALNAPELADAVPRLLAALDLEPRLADTLADWIDADDVPRSAGAERDWSLVLSPPLVPANRPLRTVGELGLVRGFARPVLQRLEPFVTVAGEHGVNPATAPRAVLLAVVGDPATVDRIGAARATIGARAAELAALVPGPAGGRLVARTLHYLVRAVAEVGDVRRAVEATLWAPAGAEPVVLAWRWVPPPPPAQ
jgi:general secretion pathway protein K